MDSILKRFSAVLILFISVQAGAYGAPIDNMLVLGASVSNDYAAPSPGRLIAGQVQLEEEQLFVQAVNGSKSTHHVEFIQNEVPQMLPDYVVALDLFFHDFKFSSSVSQNDKNRIKQIIDTLANSSREVYLGNAIDTLGFGGARIANKYIYEVIAQYDNIQIIDMDELFQKINSWDGYLYQINGQEFRVRRSDAMADIIHPNEFGTKMLANIIIDQVRRKYPVITDQELPYLPMKAPEFVAD